MPSLIKQMHIQAPAGACGWVGVLTREIVEIARDASTPGTANREKAPIIGAKVEGNPPIMSYHWVILKGNTNNVANFYPNLKWG